MSICLKRQVPGANSGRSYGYKYLLIRSECPVLRGASSDNSKHSTSVSSSSNKMNIHPELHFMPTSAFFMYQNMSRNEGKHLLGRLADGQRHVQKPYNLIRTTRINLSSLLFVILFSMLLSPCLAMNLNLASAAQYTFNSKSLVKWEDCGEINNHTLECKNITGTSTVLFWTELTRERHPNRCPLGSFQQVVR